MEPYFRERPLLCAIHSAVGCRVTSIQTKISAVQPKNDECRKQVETYRRHDKQIHRGDIRGMIAQKGPPTLAQRPPELGHILPTLDSETSNPSLSSSPWMRGPPHNGFSWLICRISARNSV